jgi:hypothetical protein
LDISGNISAKFVYFREYFREHWTFQGTLWRTSNISRNIAGNISGIIEQPKTGVHYNQPISSTHQRPHLKPAHVLPLTRMDSFNPSTTDSLEGCVDILRMPPALIDM